MAHIDTSAPPDPLIGQLLAGRFRILRLIDRGGMGRVYEARQEPLGRRCALKTLDLADPSGEFRQRFFNEARLCAQLTHPNTIRIFDYGSTPDGVYFFAMELLEGCTLREAIKSQGAFAPRRAIHVFRQLCGAIGEAHAAGIVHRDLKPANVFLCAHGDHPDFAKVLDFGLVKEISVDAGLSSRDVVLGSPMYMAPEQVEALPVDHRTDVYAIGLMLWTTLTARAPFRADSARALLTQQLLKSPPSFETALGAEHGIPASLEQLVRFAIEKAPADRLGSVRELARGLQVVQRELDGRIGPVTFGLVDGVLQVPPGAAIEDEPTLPRISTTDLDIPSGETLRTARMMPTAPVAALGAGMLLFGSSGVAALAALLLAGAAWLTFSWAPTPTPAVATIEPKPAASAPSPASEAPVHHVVVDSEPAGADVYRDAALIGSTPIDVKLPPGQAWTLRLARPGFLERQLVVDGSVDQVRVRLDPVRKTAGTPAAAAAAAAAAAPEPVAAEPEPAPAPRSGLRREVRSPWED
ncbi:MAG: hypothetical protein ACI8PZ_002515 [Myxococcota bacterium]|jgi:hypothetical protein